MYEVSIEASSRQILKILHPKDGIRESLDPATTIAYRIGLLPPCPNLGAL